MKKVMVIDDSKEILEVVEHILTAHGFEVHTHLTCFKIAETILDYKPHLILLDIRSSGKSCKQICKEIREISSIPIVLFSSLAGHEEEYKECGADGFIKKPFDLNVLVNEINFRLN